MAIKDYSSTAASNTSISGISIQGTADVKNFDNAMRQQLADIANWTDSDTLASASTTDLGSVEGMYVTISGTTTITSFGTLKAGMVKFLKFDGALTLTYNATSLILPGAASITTAAGDTAVFISEGSGNWRCLAYQRSGAQWGTKGADIASASTTDIASATGDFVKVTGTTTITALGTAPAGVERTVLFAGALTLTHNASSLILPGAANITTASGDVAVFRSEGSGNWRCIDFFRAASLPYVTTNIVGTVSQSSGTPTGAIVETGTVGSGRYIRWADGTQICTKTVTVGSVGFSASGSVYISSLVDAGAYAATFSGAPVVPAPSIFSSTGTVWATTAVAPSSSSFGQYYLLSSGSGTSSGTVLYITAYGRWF